MKHQSFFHYYAVSLVCFLLSGGAVFKTQANDELVSLQSAIDTFNNAFVSSDIVTLNKLLAPEYTHTNSGSKAFGKQRWLNWIKSRQQDTHTGVLKYNQYLTRDLEIKLFDSFAIVTGRNIADGVNRGQLFTVDIRFTHVWVKRNNQWLRAAFHDAVAK